MRCGGVGVDGYTLDTAGGMWEVLQVAKCGSCSGQLHRIGKNAAEALWFVSCQEGRGRMR